MVSELVKPHSFPEFAQTNAANRLGDIPSLVDQDLLSSASPVDRTVKAAHAVYQHLIALWIPGIIEAAYDLAVFEELTKGPADALALANTLKSDLRGMRILLDALYALGMIVRVHDANGTHRYSLTQELQACFAPQQMYSLSGKIAYDRKLAWNAWQHFANAVRTGSVDQVGQDRQNQISDSEYEHLVNGINFWAPPSINELCHGLDGLRWDTRKAVSVADVGCGTGLYSQLLLQRFPHWTAVGLDSERIAPIAREQSVQLGVENRFTSRPCNFWQDDWGSNFDLVLFANIFHLQHRDSSQQLLSLASRALAPGGLICIIDHILDDDRGARSPQDRFALLFAASMLATGGGDAYSLSDYDLWLANTGLQRVCVLDTPMHRILIAAHV